MGLPEDCSRGPQDPSMTASRWVPSSVSSSQSSLYFLPPLFPLLPLFSHFRSVWVSIVFLPQILFPPPCGFSETGAHRLDVGVLGTDKSAQSIQKVADSRPKLGSLKLGVGVHNPKADSVMASGWRPVFPSNTFPNVSFARPSDPISWIWKSRHRGEFASARGRNLFGTSTQFQTVVCTGSRPHKFLLCVGAVPVSDNPEREQD